MKDYSSKFLKSLAAALMAFPLLYISLAAVIFDIPARECVKILLAPSYYFLSAVAMIAGYGFWEMKRWAWYVYLIANLFILYSNAVLVSNSGESSQKLFAFLLASLAQAVVVFRVGSEVRVPYFLPRIRWWESNPRYKLVVPVKIGRNEGGLVIDGEILDLSMGGCFVKLRADLVQDEKLDLSFIVFGQPVQVPGFVVWRTQSTVTHPKGVGVKFATIPKDQKRNLKAITLRLKKIAAFYRSSRYLMSQEEFSKKYNELQSRVSRE